MLCGDNFGMQLQPHVIELQRIFYTVNPVQVSGGANRMFGGGGKRQVWGGQLPPLPRPRTATGLYDSFCHIFFFLHSFSLHLCLKKV